MDLVCNTFTLDAAMKLVAQLSNAYLCKKIGHDLLIYLHPMNISGLGLPTTGRIYVQAECMRGHFGHFYHHSLLSSQKKFEEKKIAEDRVRPGCAQAYTQEHSLLKATNLYYTQK